MNWVVLIFLFAPANNMPQDIVTHCFSTYAQAEYWEDSQLSTMEPRVGVILNLEVDPEYSAQCQECERNECGECDE